MADDKEVGPPVWWVFGFFCWMLVIAFCVNEKFSGRIEGGRGARKWEPIAETEARMQAQGRSLYGPKGVVDSTYTSGSESRGKVLNANVVDADMRGFTPIERKR